MKDTARVVRVLPGIIVIDGGLRGVLDGGLLDASLDAGVPDASARDASAPDSGSRDAGVPDSGSRDASAPDSGSRDASAPDAAPRDASAPDASAPDASAPDSGRRDASAPDASPPDSGPRDASAPDASAPDAAAPDAAAPDAAAPDAAAPDAAAPDAAAPDAAAPDAAPIDAGAPDASAPDASAPDASAPDAGAPDASTDASAPDASAPDASTDASLDASAPDARPDASAPDATSPPDTGPRDAGTYDGSVSLFHEPAHNLPGCYRCSVISADFDGDGLLDIVMAGAFDSAFTPGMGGYTYQNAIRIYRNTSTPGGAISFTFDHEIPGATGGGGALAVIGYFDNNNLPDFAVQFREGNAPLSDTSAYLNNGNMTFTRSVVLSNFDTNSTSLGMAAADIDRDGLDDLVFNSDAYGAAPGLWYRSTTSGAWVAQQTAYSHQITYGGTIAAGDLDGDTFPDIVVGGNSSSPFGSFDCSSTLLYGEIHLNFGGSAPSIHEDALVALADFSLRPPVPDCDGGMDNATVHITDMDGDGTNDIIVAGSAAGFRGPPGLNGSHYDFVVLFNTGGTATSFVTFENAGEQFPNGTTNGGTGNLDSPNIAAGDLDGDGYPEAFIQGHHRDYANNPSAYIFNTRLFYNTGTRSFIELELGLPDVGEGGQVMADFNNDGRIDLIFSGATIPWHSNGSNGIDYNDASTLETHVYRNTRP